MSDKIKLQNLDRLQKIVTPEGTPTQFFIRFIQDRGGNVTDLQVILDMLEEIVNSFKDNEIIAGEALEGGGKLADGDVTIDHEESPVTPGVYGDGSNVPQIVIDEFGHITGAVEVPLSVTGGSIVLIETQDLVSDQASIAFTVPTGYRDLIVRGSVRSTTGGTREDFAMTANSDTGGTKYFRNYGNIASGAYGAFQDANRNNFPFVWAPSGGAPSQQWGTFEARISDYLRTDRYKNIRCHSETSISSTDNITIDVSGAWRDTAAIASLQMFMVAGNIKAGSRISLYGVRE